MGIPIPETDDIVPVGTARPSWAFRHTTVPGASTDTAESSSLPADKSIGGPDLQEPAPNTYAPPGSSSTALSTRSSASNAKLEAQQTIDEAQENLLRALAFDLTHQFSNGFTFTPLAANIEFVDPVVPTEGRVQYHFLHAPAGNL